MEIMSLLNNIIDRGSGSNPDSFCWADPFPNESLSPTRWSDATVNASQTSTGGNLEQSTSAGIGQAILQNRFNFDGRPNITSTNWDYEADYVELGLDGLSPTAVIEQYLQIDNLAGDDMRIGYYADNGVAQSLFVEIGGSKVYEEVDSTTEANLEIKKAPFTLSDFGGSVDYSSQKSTGLEGNGIFDGRWSRSVVTNEPTTTETLTSDVVSVDIVSRSVQVEGINYSLLFTDFDDDFTLTYDITATHATASPPIGPVNGLTFYIGGQIYEFGYAHSGNLDGIGYFNGSSFVQIGADQDSGGSYTLELSRTGNNILLTVTGDVSGNSGNIAVSGDLEQVILQMSNGGGGTGTEVSSTLTLTNFAMEVNSSEFTENRVLFSKDDVLKYVYDDSNSAVNYSSLNYETFYAETYTAKCNNYTFNVDGIEYCTMI